MSATHTPGPWNIWEGPYYVGGGADLCIGAGKTWLANMDNRHCQNHAHHIGCHDDGCKLEGDADICTIDCEITDEQRANARLIAAAPELLEMVRDLTGMVVRPGTPSTFTIAAALRLLARLDGETQP